MKKLFACLLAVVASASIMMAQVDTLRGPYHTGKLVDHVFVGAGAGVKAIFATGNSAILTPAAEIYVGKWFTPGVGLRVGGMAFGIKEHYAEPNFANHFYIEPFEGDKYKYGFVYLHADGMWNMSNAIWGYKADRKLNVSPYWHVGLEVIYDPDKGIFGAARDPEFAMGPGLYLTYSLTNRLDLTADVRDVMFSERFHDYDAGGVAHIPTAFVGAAYKFGETGWKRCLGDSNAASLADANAALAAANAALAAANADKEGLAAQVKNLAAENQALKDSIANAPKNTQDVVYVKTNLGVPPLVLYYDLDVATLNVTERRHLDDYVKQVLAADPNRTFFLTGSADKGTGSYDHNVILAGNRAKGVQAILEKDYNIKDCNVIIRTGKVTDENIDPRYDRAVYIEH